MVVRALLIVLLGAVALSCIWILYWITRKTAAMPRDPLPADVDWRTPRLAIRRATAGDADALAASIDPDVMRAHGWFPKHRARMVRQLRQNRSRTAVFVACDHGTDDVVVFFDLSFAPQELAGWHLGFWTTPDHRGRGYATEALGAMAQVTHRAGVETLHLGTIEDNTAMQSVIVNAGGVPLEPRQVRLPNGTTTSSLWFVL
ncbi:MAG: GNAT family N-acetyltransferase [Actinomycetia bacterium]|nr:GNAT family N-acetyltransferase [Actinomycetes bacterium]MCP4957749.1 GNAT family N-acetyltransferase [Actinomycetes bacterium]